MAITHPADRASEEQTWNSLDSDASQSTRGIACAAVVDAARESPILDTEGATASESLR